MASMAAASAALADTYVRVEKDGTKTYSDRPIPGGKVIVLDSAQTYTPTPPMSDSSRPLEQQLLENAANFQYATCTISPSNDETFQNPESVSVSFASEPSLRPDDTLNITVDGAPVGEGQSSTVISMPDRGSHTVNAEIVDSSGRTLCSARSTFHVQRTNLNSQQRQALPQPRPRPPRPTPH
jgi:hypothetical protein